MLSAGPGGVLVEVSRALHLAGIVIDEISNKHCFEAAHIDFAVVAMLNVGEISGVAAAMIRMTIGAARAAIGGALALGEADALHIKIWDLLGGGLRSCLCFVGRTRQSATYNRKYEGDLQFVTPSYVLLRICLGPPKSVATLRLL